MIPLLGLYLVCVGFVGAALLWCVLSLFPSCRKWKAYAALRAIGLCGIVGSIGFLTVVHFQEQDQAVSSDRARRIESALEEFRKAQGRYPVSLQDLLPGYLHEIPAARAWTEVPFEYFSGPDPDRYLYRLSYRSATGVKTFRSPGEPQPGKGDH